MSPILALLLVAQQPKVVDKPEVHLVTLRYVSTTPCKTVNLVGSFNAWNRTAISLTSTPDHLHWQTSTSLAPGAYEFRFLVNDDKEFTCPEYAIQHKLNFPDVNVLVVKPDEYKKLPGRLGDNLITPSGLSHKPLSDDVKRISQRVMKIRFRTRRSDVENVLIDVTQGAEQKIYPMAQSQNDELYDYHYVRISVDPAAPIEYFFILKDGTESFRFSQKGLIQGLLVNSKFKILPNEYAVERKNSG